jgi:crotonobetainyl-CoA:carnitine CoA-transferase CaiB-like acyl-CoA transferase
MLKGIRVLDLSRIVAGPYCAALLGDLGADVIKLERPGTGDDLRGLRGSAGMSPAFAAVNRNKRGIAIDLKQEAGVALAAVLARDADVIVENFLPGVATQLGLGYAAIAAVNPRVVYASITGFGQTGPHARKPGYNSIAQGMSGVMALTGMPGDPPTRVGGSISDTATSYMAFGLINAALVHRLRTGEGQHLDLSLLASSIGLFPDHAAIFFASGERPQRFGNRSPLLTPAEVFPTADGFLNVALMNPAQWNRFCAALDDPAMENDPRFATNQSRLANHAAFVTHVEAILATRTTAAWVERLEAASIAAGPVYEFDEVFEDPQVRHLGLVVGLEQPGAGHTRMLGFPAAASAAPAEPFRPAPLLGQHTAEVLREIGVADDRIAALSEAGVIQLGPGT